MIVPPLSIDPSGLWSEVQMRKVLEVINPEARRLGMIFKPLDVTTLDMPAARFVLIPYCLEHDYPIREDEACPICILVYPYDRD